MNISKELLKLANKLNLLVTIGIDPDDGTKYFICVIKSNNEPVASKWEITARDFALAQLEIEKELLELNQRG
jgi:hypothetical protein